MDTIQKLCLCYTYKNVCQENKTSPENLNKFRSRIDKEFELPWNIIYIIYRMHLKVQ